MKVFTGPYSAPHSCFLFFPSLPPFLLVLSSPGLRKLCGLGRLGAGIPVVPVVGRGELFQPHAASSSYNYNNYHFAKEIHNAQRCCGGGCGVECLAGSPDFSIPAPGSLLLIFGFHSGCGGREEMACHWLHDRS